MRFLTRNLIKVIKKNLMSLILIDEDEEEEKEEG